jgi:glycosyltransferase involved in cell wall biosynthesis
MSKIRILAIPPDSHGVGKYRILDPFKFIGDNYSNEFHVDITLNAENNDEFFKNYDIVVFHSFIHQTNHEDNIQRINKLKSQGIKVVMDIDDYWSPDQRHPMYQQIRQNELPRKKVEMMKLSDYVTCTTDFFADTIRKKLNLKNVFVFPNAIDPNESQFQSNPTKSDKVRFGWLGGSTHLHDLELLRGGISTITNQYDNVQFVLCGFDLRGNVTEINPQTKEKRVRPIQPKETVWYKYEQIFTNDYKSVDSDYKGHLMNFTQTPEINTSDKKYVRVWTQPIGRYGNNYNLFDISLAPILPSEFNSNKSQLKIIEAGFHKKPIIASENMPYTIDLKNAFKEGKFLDDGNALLVPQNKNHKQWYKYMKLLIDNPNMVEELGNRLYETVKDKYSLVTVSKNRTDFFKTIISK